MTNNADLSRRHFLVAATLMTGGAGVVATAVPFVASFRPSARARALGAPVEVDIGKVEPGALIKVEWRGRAIMIVRRTEFMLGKLAEIGGRTRRSRIKRIPATGLRRQFSPQHPSGVSGRRGCLYASRLRPHAPL